MKKVTFTSLLPEETEISFSTVGETVLEALAGVSKEFSRLYSCRLEESVMPSVFGDIFESLLANQPYVHSEMGDGDAFRLEIADVDAETEVKIVAVHPQHPEPRTGVPSEMDTCLVTFIRDVEANHFRTMHDSGANEKAMMILNIARRHAGLPTLSRDDLPAWDGKRYAMPCNSRLLANVEAARSQHQGMEPSSSSSQDGTPGQPSYMTPIKAGYSAVPYSQVCLNGLHLAHLPVVGSGVAVLGPNGRALESEDGRPHCYSSMDEARGDVEVLTKFWPHQSS